MNKLTDLLSVDRYVKAKQRQCNDKCRQRTKIVGIRELNGYLCRRMIIID